MNKKELYIVHCVDAEGPLSEDILATFERIKKLGINLGNHKNNLKTLELLRKQKINLNGREKEIANYLAPERLNYMDTFKKLEVMINKIINPKFRNKYKDSTGQPYLYSWFIMDFVGFNTNPRNRPEGFHVMWDWYHEKLKNQIYNDGFYWHFHTVPVSGIGNEYNSSWTNNDYHEQVLCRRLDKYNWFPSIYRSGGHIQSLDQSNWLEMFIPFDFSRSDYFSKDRSTGDWRNSPKSWRGYNPNFYDNRKKGKMNRRIFRCIEINNGRSHISKKEIQSAFNEANSGKPAILAYSNHDRRDIEPEVDFVYDLICKTSTKFPDVTWKFKNSLDAIRLCHDLKLRSKPSISLKLKNDLLLIKSNIETFSTLPYISIKNTNNIYFRDNPMIEKKNIFWIYKIRNILSVSSISVAVSYKDGSVLTKNILINE